MSRRHSAEKREIAVDARFGDAVGSKLINIMMYGGKKAVSEKIVYDAIEKAAARAHQEPVQVFHTALDNVRPDLEVRSRRVGGATYQVPVEVRPERAQELALRWLNGAARARSEKNLGAPPSNGNLAPDNTAGSTGNKHQQPTRS